MNPIETCEPQTSVVVAAATHEPIPPLALEKVMIENASYECVEDSGSKESPVLPVESPPQPMRNQATPEEKERQGLAATSMLRRLDLSGITNSGEIDSEILISGSRKQLSAREEKSPRDHSRSTHLNAASPLNGIQAPSSLQQPTVSPLPISAQTGSSASASSPSSSTQAIPPKPSPLSTLAPPSASPGRSNIQDLLEEDIIVKGRKERLRARDPSPEGMGDDRKDRELESLDLTGLDSLLSPLQSPSKSKKKEPLPSTPTLQLSPYSLIGSFTGGSQSSSPIASKKTHRVAVGDPIDEALQKFKLHQDFNVHVIQQHEQQLKAVTGSFPPSPRPESPPRMPQSPLVHQETKTSSSTTNVTKAMGSYLTQGAFGGSVPIKSDVERGVMFERHPVASVNPVLQPFLRSSHSPTAQSLTTTNPKHSEKGPAPPSPASLGGVVAQSGNPVNPVNKSKILPNGVPANRLESARIAKEGKRAAARQTLIYGHEQKHSLEDAGKSSAPPSPVPQRAHPSVPLLSLQGQEQQQQQQQLADSALVSPRGFSLDSPTETPRIQAHSLVMHKAIETSFGHSSSGPGGPFTVVKKSQSVRQGATIHGLDVAASGSPGVTLEKKGSHAQRNARILDKMGQLESPALNSKTSEPILDDSFFREIQKHFTQTALDQKTELQKKMNGSLGPILNSFGVRHIAEGLQLKRS